MDITVTNASDTPIYRQIYEQLRAQIVKGELPRGSCLPPIRTVAAELRVSVITVKKAWEELERGGYIDTMAGRGCFVADISALEPDVGREGLALARLNEALDYCASLGYTREEALALLKRESGIDAPGDPELG